MQDKQNSTVIFYNVLPMQHHQAFLAAYSIASETATINHHVSHLPAAVAAAHLQHQHQQFQHHLNKQQQQHQQQQVQSHHRALLAANQLAGNQSAALAAIAAAKNVNQQQQQQVIQKNCYVVFKRTGKCDKKDLIFGAFLFKFFTLILPLFNQSLQIQIFASGFIQK